MTSQGRDDPTSEAAYFGRRRLLSMAPGLIALASGSGCEGPASARALQPVRAARSTRFSVDRAITPASIAGRYNNFYEFGPDKEAVAERARRMQTEGWTVELAGLVDRPARFDLDQLARLMPIEERVYRFRCVEAWAMVVPWTGFPLRALLEHVGVKSDARFVRFETFGRSHGVGAPGFETQSWYPWPYVEALRLDEAMNELTLLATGLYGRALPPQHGAPIRLVVPWKYGFKSIKSVVRIELTRTQPVTFWNGLEPREYGFFANVDPLTPHPRWSQATHRWIDTGSRSPTKIYNGYGGFVAQLYPAGPSARR